MAINVYHQHYIIDSQHRSDSIYIYQLYTHGHTLANESG